MSTLTLDQWLEEYVPVDVTTPGKPPFTVTFDFAALGISLYEATDAALEAAGALADKAEAETARLAAYRRLFARLVRTFNGYPLPAADVARLPEATCDAIWRAFQAALVPNDGRSDSTVSPAKDEDSEPGPGGLES